MDTDGKGCNKEDSRDSSQFRILAATLVLVWSFAKRKKVQKKSGCQHWLMLAKMGSKPNKKYINTVAKSSKKKVCNIDAKTETITY